MKQRQALVDNVEADIRAVTAQQDRLLRQISATEKSSQAVMAKCAEHVDLDTTRVTVANIAERVNPPQSEQLMDTTRKLLERGIRVRRENMINRHLLNNLIRFTGYCLRRIARVDQPAPAYRSDGLVAQQAARCITLDSRV